MKVDGNTVYVPLNKPKHGGKRKFALIDLDEVGRVSLHKWYAQLSGRTCYVIATASAGLPSHHMRLHAFIMRAEKGQRFDHINGDGLDNRKENLRLAASAQNARNTFKTNSSHVTSKFKGVSLSSSGRWIAQIRFEGQPQALGVFDDEEDAARAYDTAAIRLFKEFAKTNADMGLFDSAAPNRREPDYGLNADHVMPSQLLGREAKPHWQSLMERSEPEIDRSIPHRERRRKRAA